MPAALGGGPASARGRSWPGDARHFHFLAVGTRCEGGDSRGEEVKVKNVPFLPRGDEAKVKNVPFFPETPREPAGGSRVWRCEWMRPRTR